MNTTRIRTDTLRHRTIETDKTTNTLRSDVSDSMLDKIKPLVRLALGGNRVLLKPSEFSLEIDSVDDILRGAIFHPRIGPIRVTVTPPERDGLPARLDVSIDKMLAAAASGKTDTTAFLMAGDMERRIAWAWLAIRGYSN